jgi:hypothetical protein
MNGSNRRLEFELGTWFEGSCGFALALALSQMREHGLGPFGRAEGPERGQVEAWRRAARRGLPRVLISITIPFPG